MATNITPAAGLSIGDVLPISATFLTAAGDPATIQASEITARVKPATGTATTIDTGDISVASGVASFDFTCATGGEHAVHVEWASGVDGAAVDAEFSVEPDQTAT